MTIMDRDAATVYTAMGDDSRPRPGKLLAAVEAADAAWEALREVCDTHGLACPNDDRAENAVHAVFRALVEANGMNVADLASVIRATEV